MKTNDKHLSLEQRRLEGDAPLEYRVHTPGPWTISDSLPVGRYVVRDARGLLVATLPNHDESPLRQSENHANARLIVAAPETAAERDRLRKVNEECVAALRLFQAALTEYKLRDVKKRYSLCLADAAASTAIFNAEKQT